MYAKTAVLLLPLTLVGLSSGMAAPAASTPAVPELDHDSGDYNMTKYLVSAEEVKAAMEGKKIHKRGQPGVYYCEHANWGWPCWWQPAVKQCVNKANNGPWSLGPDKGVNCAQYQYTGCTQQGQGEYNLLHPGSTNIPGYFESWKCATTLITGGADAGK